MRKSRTRKRGRIRKFFRVLFLVLLGVFIGVLGFEAIMLVRVLRLRTHNPGSTSLIETRTKEANARGQQARREQIWVPINQISPNLQRAILAGEDTNFLTHRGFDYEALQKVWDLAQREAAREAKSEGDDEGDWLPSLPDFKRGASTVTQQLAKNLYLTSQRTFVRKGQEAVLTVFLERFLTKRRILEIYLNVIEWGDGVYGAEAAARRYFNKSAASLTTNEAAYLSAMVPNPRTIFNPRINPRRVARRQRIIMRGMPYQRIP